MLDTLFHKAKIILNSKIFFSFRQNTDISKKEILEQVHTVLTVQPNRNWHDKNYIKNTINK